MAFYPLNITLRQALSTCEPMQDKNKTVLVTGAAGFIGRHLCRHLCNSGFQVRSLLHNAEQKELFAPELELEHFTGDLLNAASLEAAWPTGTDPPSFSSS